MAWTTAVSDLRAQLSDGVTDKLAFQKRVVGYPNGTSKTFKTFDTRRVSVFTSPVSPCGVYVNGAIVAVDSDDTVSGVFTVHTPPLEGDTIEATYYHQWFTDAQLNAFLAAACQQMGFSSDFASLGDGLWPSAIKYACADAYQELAVRYSRMLSEQFMMEDLPKEQLNKTIEGWTNLAKAYRKEAYDAIKWYWTRQGSNLEPNFTTIIGNVREVAPNS